MRTDLTIYREELSAELENMLRYWQDFSVDEINGGFVGRIDNDNHIDYSAPKGAVLNARILWSFAAAYNLKSNPDDLVLADLAFTYLADHFIDREMGGVYWMLDAKGNPIDTKKQVYAIAFTIYAASEYFMASGNKAAKEMAVSLYTSLIEKAYDPEKGGYFEAFSRDWTALDDLRLSVKDANEKKTMNTHLHVLEAFTSLYRIMPDAGLHARIAELLHDFTTHIVDAATGHLTLFFDENWTAKSALVSYGHDIEAAWLLLEAAEVIQDEALIAVAKALAVNMARVAVEGLDVDGSLWYEYDPAAAHPVKEKHWWVQAEAMVGFFNAWEISKEEHFLEISLRNWAFVKAQIIDHEKGEWFWGRTAAGEIMPGEDKVGPWKCPYHNSRACIELIRRISK